MASLSWRSLMPNGTTVATISGWHSYTYTNSMRMTCSGLYLSISNPSTRFLAEHRTDYMIHWKAKSMRDESWVEETRFFSTYMSGGGLKEGFGRSRHRRRRKGTVRPGEGEEGVLTSTISLLLFLLRGCSLRLSRVWCSAASYQRAGGCLHHPWRPTETRALKDFQRSSLKITQCLAPVNMKRTCSKSTRRGSSPDTILNRLLQFPHLNRPHAWFTIRSPLFFLLIISLSLVIYLIYIILLFIIQILLILSFNNLYYRKKYFRNI